MNIWFDVNTKADGADVYEIWVTGNGILEEAEGMEAFWNQDWKGSVIICPGGGYQWLSPREGEPVAKAFAALGWKPWILYYSVAGPGEVLGTEPVKQAAEAVKMVRMWETEKPVFLCGFQQGAMWLPVWECCGMNRRYFQRIRLKA